MHSFVYKAVKIAWRYWGTALITRKEKGRRLPPIRKSRRSYCSLYHTTAFLAGAPLLQRQQQHTPGRSLWGHTISITLQQKQQQWQQQQQQQHSKQCWAKNFSSFPLRSPSSLNSHDDDDDHLHPQVPGTAVGIPVNANASFSLTHLAPHSRHGQKTLGIRLLRRCIVNRGKRLIILQKVHRNVS